MQVTYMTPEAMPKPVGLYSHVALAGNLAFFAGQVGATTDDSGPAVPFAEQLVRIYEALGQGLESVGSDWKHVVNLTTFLVSQVTMAEYMEARGGVYNELFGDGPHPPHALAVVEALAHPALLIEITAVAAIP